MKALRGRLSYANVVATLALFVALGGGAYAVTAGRNTVGSKQLRPGAVKLKDTATSLRLKCPGGTRYHEGACIETAQRGNGTILDAITGCNNAGRRLPDTGELLGFAREPGITVGPIPAVEWAAGLDSAPTGLQAAAVSEQAAQVLFVTDPFDDVHAYRCVANARR